MNNYYSMNETYGKRDITFDIAKGMGIFLVIIEHMPSFMPEWIRIYISSFHMPLFFFISGYFAKEIKNREEFTAKLKKITRSIMHMYIEYSIVFMLLEFAALNYDFYHLAKSVEKMFLGYGGYYVLWFLFSLYFVEVIFYLLIFCADKYINLLALLIVFWGVMCGKAQINYFKIGSSCYAFGFFYLGFVFKNRNLFDEFLRKELFVPLMLIHYFLVVFLYKKFGYILGIVDNQSINVVCNYFIALTGISQVIFVARILGKSRIFAIPLGYIGRNSIYFYPLTAFIPDYCKLLFGNSPILKILSRGVSFPIAIVYMKGRKRILSCLKRN